MKKQKAFNEHEKYEILFSGLKTCLNMVPFNFEKIMI